MSTLQSYNLVRKSFVAKLVNLEQEYKKDKNGVRRHKGKYLKKEKLNEIEGRLQELKSDIAQVDKDIQRTSEEIIAQARAKRTVPKKDEAPRIKITKDDRPLKYSPFAGLTLSALKS